MRTSSGALLYTYYLCQVDRVCPQQGKRTRRSSPSSSLPSHFPIVPLFPFSPHNLSLQHSHFWKTIFNGKCRCCSYSRHSALAIAKRRLERVNKRQLIIIFVCEPASYTASDCLLASSSCIVCQNISMKKGEK